MEGRGGVVRRWLSGVEMGRSGAVKSGGNSEMKLDVEIKSSVEDLVPILSESEGISDDTCNVPSCYNSLSLDLLSDHYDIFSDFNNDRNSSDEVSFEDIDYIEASPPDSKLVSLEEVKNDIVTPLFVKKTLCHNLGLSSKHS
uniref:Reverse transcriptase domain-containing protein n=1 Tax=Tanacetum cinerariifolium TaxID=118510 RepID=A0A6L2NJQ8_TANCI|nr:hypothetical protein [Tanacetum cinerariifolium]